MGGMEEGAGERRCTAFVGDRVLAAGPLVEVALAVRAARDPDESEPVLTFDDATGRLVDLEVGRPHRQAARARASEARGRLQGGDPAAAPLGVARGSAGWGVGDAAPAGRRGAPEGRGT